MGRNLSPETKEKLSRLAKERIARGEMGGQFGKLGGRPRKRASQSVARAALEEENVDRLIQVFKDATAPGQPMHVRLRGAMAWLEIEREEAKTLLAEMEADSKQYGRSELLNMLKEKLTQGPAAKLLKNSPSLAVIEGEVLEEDDD